MTSEVSIALAVLFGGGLFIAGVSRVAPLTAWESPVPTRQISEKHEAAKDGGYAHCRAELSGVDCECFSQKASQILQEDNQQIAGWTYADKWDLAKSQATAACS